MSNLNLAKAVIAGHLVKEPELKQTPNGTPCTTFSVAVNRKSESENSTVTDYHTVIAWSKLAEHVCRYFKKGSAIYVEGKLRLRSFTDKNGVNRKIPEITASEVNFVDAKTIPDSEAPPREIGTYVHDSVVELIGSTDDDLPF